MKENGMEKLVKLFKEYVDKHGTDTKDVEKEYGVIDYGQGLQYGTREYFYETIVSKKFGFINRLVKKNKIDRERINNRWGDMSVHFTDEELFIMSLSISSSPIEDLISYLK